MKWKRITINTTTEATDIVASVLFDNNIVGAEIEDNQNLTKEELSKMYVDIPKINVDDGKAKVSFYVSIGNKVDNDLDVKDNNLVDISTIKSSDNIFEKEEFENIFKNIKEELESYRDFVDMGTLDISEVYVDDDLFLKKWKDNFKRIEIDDIVILPSFEKNTTCYSDKLNIFIEPGNAFGTGQHSTTKLCVKSLNKLFKGTSVNKVLDIGCGSGILSIIAKRLGSKNVIAIDVDENVEFNLIENLSLNGIENIKRLNNYNLNNSEIVEKYKVSEINDLENFDVNNSFIYSFGNIITDDSFKRKICKYKYDIIIANILSPVIISLIEKCGIHNMLSENGYLILSGIIKDKEQEVSNCINNNITYKSIEKDYDNEWVSFTIEV